jgi:hypothetical protein
MYIYIQLTNSLSTVSCHIIKIALAICSLSVSVSLSLFFSLPICLSISLLCIYIYPTYQLFEYSQLSHNQDCTCKLQTHIGLFLSTLL